MEYVNGLVSIVMPAYNCSKYISESIESVIAQTYPNWELIVVDDRSTDGTREILASYEQREPVRIRVLANKANSGAARSRNRAIREARGQWVAFLDSDDLWLPTKLEKQLAFMEEIGASFSYTDYVHVDGAGNPLGVRVSGPDRISQRDFFRYCWVGCLTVMYDAQVNGLIQVPPLKNREDYALWLKLAKKSDCFRLGEVLALYRKGYGDTLSSGGFRRLIKHHYRMFRVSEGQGPLEASFSTGRNLVFGFFKKAYFVRSYR